MKTLSQFVGSAAILAVIVVTGIYAYNHSGDIEQRLRSLIAGTKTEERKAEQNVQRFEAIGRHRQQDINRTERCIRGITNKKKTAEEEKEAKDALLMQFRDAIKTEQPIFLNGREITPEEVARKVELLLVEREQQEQQLLELDNHLETLCGMKEGYEKDYREFPTMLARLKADWEVLKLKIELAENLADLIKENGSIPNLHDLFDETQRSLGEASAKYNGTWKEAEVFTFSSAGKGGKPAADLREAALANIEASLGKSLGN